MRHRLDPKHVVGVVFVVGLFMNILDSTVVNVALPAIAEDFGVAAASAEWVVVGYLLSLAVWIPASGWIGDRFGTKRTFLTALVIFTAASALCGLADSLEQLIAFRILQGVGGGMLTPVGTAMLFRAFPPSERAAAARVLIIPTVTAPALGPIVGGLLVDSLSWRWIFFVNLPIGVAASVFGAIFLEEHREPTAGPFDVPGFVLSGGSLALGLYALSQGPSEGWASPTVIGTGALAVAGFVAMTSVELRRRAPLLDLRLYGNRLFRATNLASFFGYGGFIGLLFGVTLYLQALRGESALQSGLTTFPEAIGVLVASQVAGRVYGHVGPRRLIAAGLAGTAVGMLVLTRVGLGTDLWLIRVVMFGIGACMAFVFMPLQAATFATVSSARMGRASALFNTQRQTAAAFGVAVLATVLQAVDGGRTITSFRAAFLCAALFAAIGCVLALWIDDREAAETMHPRPGAEPLVELSPSSPPRSV
jgi:EmrB/QacA subfamily drug resistance transporter